MEEKKEFLREQEAASAASNGSVDTVPEKGEVDEDEEEKLVIRLKKPYKFEGREYTEIDLSGLEELTSADMISVNRIMSRGSNGIDVMPEVSVEYACHLAARAAKLPVEFFLGLQPRYAMKVKNRVMGFLFGAD